MPELCPTCGQPFPEKRKRRMCAQCGKPILAHHKFLFDGSSVRHRICSAPTEYEVKREEPVETMRLLP